MPQPRREQSRDVSADAAARIVSGPDPDRFYCPHPGCNRSFAELWRLKVHFRAPPDVRGSGKERGHGTELKFCPKCGKELKPGKHHVGCSAGKSAPRQAAKRQRQMSSTTESDWVSPTSTSSLGEAYSDSWEDTVRRQVSKVNRQRSLDTDVGTGRKAGSVAGPSARRGQGGSAAAGGAGPSQRDVACRIQKMLGEGGDQNAELVFTANTMADFGLILRSNPTNGTDAGGQNDRPGSPSLSNILDGVSPMEGPTDLASLPLLRVPSPPPLPPDWDLGFGPNNHGPSLLFDFDQFDANRRATMGGLVEPVMTVTSAMNPAEMSNPSDDYIWQIMFAGENAVPKRVTAHLHHPAEARAENSDDIARMFDDHSDLLDNIDWVDPAVGAVTGGGKAPNGQAAAAVAAEVKQEHAAGAGAMQPPPNRPTVPPVDNLPPPPAEALQAAQQAQQPQTITVTYVVQPGGSSGQPQYAVKSVAPGGAASPPADGAAVEPPKS